MILHLTAIHHRTAPLTVGSALTQVIDSDQCEGFVDTVEAEPYSKSPTKHEVTRRASRLHGFGNGRFSQGKACTEKFCL